MNFASMRIAQCVRTTALWRTIPVCAGMRKERLTMREKLIELLAEDCKKWAEVDGVVLCSTCADYCDEHREGCFGNLADHLLANGVIVLPCKVGQEVWLTTDPWTDKRLKKPLKAEVNAVKKYSHGVYANILFDTPKHNGTRDRNVDDIGRTVFLTREEAEAALRKEGQG